VGVIAPGNRRNGVGAYSPPPAARLVNLRKSRPGSEKSRIVHKAVLGAKIGDENPLTQGPRESARVLRESTSGTG